MILDILLVALVAVVLLTIAAAAGAAIALAVFSRAVRDALPAPREHNRVRGRPPGERLDNG